MVCQDLDRAFETPHALGADIEDLDQPMPQVRQQRAQLAQPLLNRMLFVVYPKPYERIPT